MLTALDSLARDWSECRVRRRVNGVELRRYVTRRGTSIVFSVEQVSGQGVVFVRYVTHARRRQLYPGHRDVQSYDETPRLDGGPPWDE